MHTASAMLLHSKLYSTLPLTFNSFNLQDNFVQKIH